MKTSVIIALFFLTLFTATPCKADNEPYTLSLEEAVTRAYENNLQVQAAKLSPQIAAQYLHAEQAIYIPRINLLARYTDAMTPLSAQFSTFAGGLKSIQSKTYAYSTDLSQLIPSGGTVSLFGTFNDESSTFTGFDSEYSGYGGLSFKQPLLKNAGTTVTNSSITLSRIEAEIQKAVEKDLVLTALASVEKLYWDIVLYTNAVSLSEESLALAQSLYDETAKKTRAGILSQLELIQARAGVAQRKENLIISRQLERSAINSLKQIIKLNNVTGSIVLTDKPEKNTHDFDVHELIHQALAYRPDYLISTKTLELLETQTALAKNQILPALNLEAALMYHGISGSAGDVMDQVSGNDFEEWTVGLTMSIPLWLKKELALYRAAKLKKSQEVLRVADLGERIETEVINTLGDLETNALRIETAEENLSAAKEALDAENKKYSVGNSTARRVLDYQRDYMSAKVDLIRAQTDYRKSLVSLYQTTGTYLNQWDLN